MKRPVKWSSSVCFVKKWNTKLCLPTELNMNIIFKFCFSPLSVPEGLLARTCACFHSASVQCEVGGKVTAAQSI